MTTGEKAVWIAVYAASWHQSMGGPIGAMDDDPRATWASVQADRSLAALLGVRDRVAQHQVGGSIAEVLE